MLKNSTILVIILSVTFAERYINQRHRRPQAVRYYPKESVFRKADLIDRGCSVFLKDCPSYYKQSLVCARHYDGMYKIFNNYCEMEYENCNSWRQWSMVRQGRC